jgi:hypothetical protein
MGAGTVFLKGDIIPSFDTKATFTSLKNQAEEQKEFTILA